MRIVDSFPRRVRTIENVWIPLSDGVRLAARVWLPDDAEEDPVPAILEYIPYRKRDFTRGRDEPMHRYLAGHGYACARVDVRGSGDSEGLLEDEYTEREQLDGVEAIEWLAGQPWCTGAVGMMGISWGGFNALQVAARRPPALRAVITLCASDDCYADDAHYMGGCLLNENLTWGSVLLAFSALPPDPAVVGEGWRGMWRRRLEGSVLFPARWLRHQRRDAYWKHGSVCEDYPAIACPVYAIGGWSDGYSNAVPRLLAGLRGPRRGLIGPWSHAFPHDATPGPSVGFLQEAVRWWDRWLKGIENGIMEEPMYRVWLQECIPPQPTVVERPGGWIAEPVWPSPSVTVRTLYLTGTGIREAPAPETTLRVRSPFTTGIAAGDWCAFGSEGDQPGDQREDDGRSLLFDSVPLTEPLTILGAPEVVLDLAADRPCATIAVRLNDVTPAGASLRVTYGLLNLTHREGHERPRPLAPGRSYRVRVRLNDIAHTFLPGQRLRVAVSTSYWPIAWPAPEPFALDVHAGACELRLPVRTGGGGDDALPAFGPPEAAPPHVHDILSPVRLKRAIERDLLTNETTYTIFSDGGDYEGAALARLAEIDLELGHTIHREFRIGPRDPLSARAEIVQRTQLRREGWNVRVETRAEMGCTAEEFRVRAELTAYEAEARVFERRWDERIPRDLV